MIKKSIKTTVYLAFFLWTSFGWSQDKIVRVKPGFATVVVCPANPDLVTAGNLDDFHIQSAGNYVLVKPLVSEGTTNLFITVGNKTFNLLLQVSETPDLEIRLDSLTEPRSGLSVSKQSDDPEKTVESNLKSASAARRKPLSSMNPKVINTLFGSFKTPNRYTFSVANSQVIFAIDHMKQIKDHLYIIGTIINSSNIPYDVGYVRFRLVDFSRSYLFWKKKTKQVDLEPLHEYYNPNIKPHTSGRLLFVFDKHGFSHDSTLEVKCTEENGRRTLVLQVPGSIVE